MKLEFSLDLFWMMGIICFIIIALGNLYSTNHAWEYLDIGARVSRSAGIAFNFLLAYFFFWMLKGSRKTKAGVEEMKTDKEILELFKDKEKAFFKK